MSRKAAQIILSPEERATGNEWARSRTMPLRVVQRARIIQMASNGTDSQDIAKALGISRPTVQLWRQRFLALRRAGLEKVPHALGAFPELATRKFERLLKPPCIQNPRMRRIGVAEAWPALKGSAKPQFAAFGTNIISSLT
jgi:hypothetical protein